VTETAATADTMLATAPQAASFIAPGTMIDHYRVDKQLGAGGMGVVYRARDTKLGRDVAIKLLRDAAPGTDTCSVLCALLRNEAQLMARLAHPNLVAVFDTGLHGSCVYVALELVEGDTLRDWCARGDRSSPERLAVLLEAGEGLIAAHGARVYHRDIKPENVLVSDGGRARVTDFGIARSTADINTDGAAVGCGCTTSAADLEAATAISGTPAYMAPEQLRGEPADARCDQFSFAVMCWEILYGALPFRGETPLARLAAITGQELDPPAAPTAVTDVLRRALRARPDVRYPSMRAFVDALRNAGT
jgi:eukaryotic-like serine/threonine-protein kinase